MELVGPDVDEKHVELIAERAAWTAVRQHQVDSMAAIREGVREEVSAKLTTIDQKLDALTTEVSEYRGALRFGKWAAGLLIALGVPASLLAYWGSGLHK